jgi:KaiC/GvpD/RAD55 family RecA-like ATPase
MEIQVFESILIKFMFQNVEKREKILPFLSPSLFDNFENKEIVNYIFKFQSEYEKFPTVSDLKVFISKEEVFNKLLEIINLDISEYSEDYIEIEIGKFLQKKLIWNTIVDLSENLKEDKIGEMGVAPDKIREALAFSFDSRIGLDFLESPDELYDFLHNKDNVISSGIKALDKIMEGGFHEKSLTLFMAETNLGKTLVKVAFAVNALLHNKNVLYITLEMSEHKISERVMANVFDVPMKELRCIMKDKFLEKFAKTKEKIQHKLIIQEYPTSSINTNHIRNLIKELKIKKNFVPDIIFVDYLELMKASSMGKDETVYHEIKKISEELRGLAMEVKAPIVSSVQTNRKGFSSSDIDLTNISDSIGPAKTADVIIGITQSDEFRKAGKFTFIILKNRYGLNKMKCYVCVDYDKMRITGVPEDENKTAEQIKKENPTTMADDAVVKKIQGIMKQDKQEIKDKIIKLED